MPPNRSALWESLSPRTDGIQRVVKNIVTDVAVIGGGILGCSTALHLAESGINVTLLEARRIGYGASGRNTGFVVPSLAGYLGPTKIADALGRERAARLLNFVAGSGDTVFGLINRLQIQCDAERVGWLQPGHSAAAEAELASRLSLMEEMGVHVEFRGRADMRRMTGLPWVHGGYHLTSGGQLNPLAYVLGLAKAAQRVGGQIFEDSPATTITPQGNGWRVETPNGCIHADRVLLTTNAMVGRLVPCMSKTFVPVTIYQVATGPLPAELRRLILPSGAPVSDTRRHTFALRWSPDGRLMTGGMVSPTLDRTHTAARSFVRRIEKLVPGLPALEADFVWSGKIAVTLDALPRLINLAPGLHGALGCNGRGVALCTTLGRELAQLYANRAASDNFVLPITPPNPIPFAALSAIGPHLLKPWMEFRDALDTRWDETGDNP